MSEAALSLTIMAPFAGGILSILSRRRYSSLLATIAILLILASVGLLAFDLVEGVRSVERIKGLVWRHALSGWPAPLGIALHVDGLAVGMLLLTAIVAGAVGIYALGYFPKSYGDDHDPKAADPQAGGAGFWPIFFFMWGSLNVIFLVADVFTIYVCLELITLAAVAGIALERGASALKASIRYLMAALMGSLIYLLGVAFVYGQVGSLDWTIIATTGDTSPTMMLALSLLTAGLLVKTALFPLHFWLPGAHAIAAAPVSALLSALVVKASFYVLLRFWVQVFPDVVGLVAAHFLGVLGAAAVIWGSFQAIVQRRVKLMVAYSTVAQIGYLFIGIPLLYAAFDTTDASAQADAWNGVVFFAISHGIAKATLFMAAGIYLAVDGTDQIERLNGAAAKAPIATLAWGLAGASIIGLPPSGGFLAKWLLLTSAIRFGYWLYAGVILAGGLLASMYVFRVLWHAFLTETEATKDAPIMERLPRALPLTTLFLGILIVVVGTRTTELFELINIGSPFAERGEP